MPGGRNKYTGPVNYSEEEVGDILTGREYANLPPLPPTHSPRNAPMSIMSNQSSNQNLLQLPYYGSNAPVGQMPYYVNQMTSPLSRAPKRRRSHASELHGLPTAKMAPKSGPKREFNPSAPEQAPPVGQNPAESNYAFFSPIFSPIALQVVDRLHEAEEKEILNFNAIWPAFKLQEKINQEQFLEAIPKIAEQVICFSYKVTRFWDNNFKVCPSLIKLFIGPGGTPLAF